MNNKIILLSGDPNSINTEIINKTLRKLPNNTKKKIYLISNYNLIEKQLKILKSNLKIIKVKNLDEQISSNKLKIIDLKMNFRNPFKVSEKSASDFIIKSLNLAHKLALRKDVIGIINCPVNKKLLKKNKIGVTEYLALKCKIRDNSEVMLIKSKKLAVSPITTHLDVREISNNLNTRKIVNKVTTLNSWYKKQLRNKPKIAILGLNPHNAELRKNSEEKKIIIPAILKLKKKGLDIIGPLAADTIFINDYKNYDVIVGMFHDQIIPPFKTLFKFDAINVTLGLKYLRVSPDHGTAYNLIKKNKANHKSLKECIKFLNKFN